MCLIFFVDFDRVQQVHEKWVNIRTLLQTKLINILNIHTNPDFKFLAECTEWVHQKLVSPTFRSFTKKYFSTNKSRARRIQDRWVLMLKKINQNSFDGSSNSPGNNHNGKSIYVPGSSAHELSITNTKSTKTVIEMRYPTSGGTQGHDPSGAHIGTPGHAPGGALAGAHGGSTVEIVTVEGHTNTDFANDFDQEECYEWVSCKLVSSRVRILKRHLNFHNTWIAHLLATPGAILFGY